MITAAEADVDSDGLEESELLGLTITQLKGLAADAGYEITKTKKADIIEEILAAASVDLTGDLDEDDLALFAAEKILEIAETREYTMTKTAEDGKAAVITEFLAIQNA